MKVQIQKLASKAKTQKEEQMKEQIQKPASKAKNKKEEQMKEQLQKIQLNSKTKNQKENKMKATRNFTLAMMTLILSLTLSSCSENPVNSFSQNDQLQVSNSLSASRPTERMLIVEHLMSQGETIEISTADFDQMGLAAFLAVEVEVTDPTSPPFQSDISCERIMVAIDRDGYRLHRKDCKTFNFNSQIIRLTNNNDRPVALKAYITCLIEMGR